jgi:hypothetical protein
MESSKKRENGWTGVMRWVARLLALMAGGLFVYFAVEFGAKVFPTLSWGPQGIPLMAVVLVAILGGLLAWRWELVGGLMATGGALLTMILVCAGSGMDMFLCALFFTLPLLVAGTLYLGCCWRKRALNLANDA